MSENLGPPDPTDDLQFQVAEPAAPQSSGAEPQFQPPPSQRTQTCAACRQTITDTYYAVRDKPICPACRDKFQTPATGKFGRFMKATLLGLGAGLVGALIWFLIRRLMNLELGLIAVLVGFMVGKAVRLGSGGRGGRGYQVLAVLLTYSCIAANYMPDVLEAVINDMHKDHPQLTAANADPAAQTQPSQTDAAQSDSPTTAPAPASRAAHGPLAKAGALALALVLLFVLSLATPVLIGIHSPIGLLIVGFALWEAWKFNRGLNLSITGPFKFGPGASAPAPSLWIKP